MLQQTIRSWIDQLLVYIGISADSARGIDQWVILAIIVAIGVGLDFLIRLLLLQVVRRVVKQTKVTWDDIIFDDKVLRRLTIPAYKVVSGFDDSQTEGKELPDIAVDELTGDVDRY